VAITPADLLVMELAPDAAGKPRHVIIQLMPAPFGQSWVGNIRKLAAAHWWDGTTVYRVQDNYVAQWGDADGDGPDPAKAKPLPQGLAKVSESEYAITQDTHDRCDRDVCHAAPASVGLWSQDIWYGKDHAIAGIAQGWPVAFHPGQSGHSETWPAHCYGMVGVARDLSPDTGTGAELYTVIGQSPRALDRNIALVGRVIEGIDHLSSLPRGPAPLGVYVDTSLRVPIRSVRLASESPAAEQPRFQYLSTESASFRSYVDKVANRQDAFFRVPAGGADICSVKVPIRRAP
jgi:peptidylprolyl isomerase